MIQNFILLKECRSERNNFFKYSTYKWEWWSRLSRFIENES